MPSNDSVDVLRLYKEFATLPELSNAWIDVPNDQSINDRSTNEWPDVRIQTSVRDIEQDTKREYHTMYTQKSINQSYRPSQSIQSDTIGVFPSPSNKLNLTIKKLVSKNAVATSPQYIIDLVDQSTNRLIDSIVTTGIHGRIFTGGFFGSFDWSSDESMIVFVAEPEPAKSGPFFDASKRANQSINQSVSASLNKSDNQEIRGKQYDWKEDYGELLVGVTHPRPFILSINQPINQSNNQSILSIMPIEGLPVDKWTLGQARFTPSINQSNSESINQSIDLSSDQKSNQLSLVCVGWDHSDRRCGVAAYNSRPSNLFHLVINQSINQSSGELSGEALKQSINPSIKLELQSMYQLTDSAIDHSALSPRFSPFNQSINQSTNQSTIQSTNQIKLVFTSTDAVWHHQSTTRLRLIDWSEWCKKIASDISQATGQSSKKPTDSESVNQSTDSESINQSIKVSINQSFVTDNATTVLDIVRAPKSISEFPGFYPAGGMLPSNCWIDDCHIICSTHWRIRDRLIVINVINQSITEIEIPLHLDSQLVDASMSVMSVRRNLVVVSISTLIRPAAAYMMRISFNQSINQSANQSVNQSTSQTFESFMGHKESATVDWQQLTTSPKPLNQSVNQRFNELRFDVISVSPDDSMVSYKSYDELPFDAILIYRKQSSINQSVDKLPLHLLPHGGPHAAFSTAFSFACAYLACANHAILLINYRGSTGYGQSMLECLPGHCGDQDVRDCMRALQAVHSNERYDSLIDHLKTGVFGGSHGGWLTTHLIGQYPSKFYCATTRNPVTNCALMVGLTDIVDWVYHEVGLHYDTKRAPTAHDYSTMFDASPIKHVEQVKTPLLLLLGAADRRVPPQQGLDYYRILKSRGVDTRLLMYPDAGHSLNESVAQEADVWCNTLLWMLERRQGNKDLSC